MKHIPEIETESPPKILAFQEKKLREHLLYLKDNSPFYRQHFLKHNVSTEDIKSVEDIQRIPPVTKEDLQLYNWDFLCVDSNKIVEYTSTSGTLGKPVTIALTENDLQRLAYNELISFACADGTSDDLYQLMLTLDRQFMAGIAYYEGIRKMGAGLIRIGPGLPAMQWETIERLKPSIVVAVPSFLLKLIDYALQNNIDLNSSSVRRAVCIGESIRTNSFELNVIGRKIKEAWDIDLYGTYASTEMQTAFTECEQGKGGHHHPELLIVEFLDDNSNPVKEGEAGEITITTLGVEGMPLLRYKTGDIAISYREACQCGRTTLRIGPILGRKQQMIKLKGTTLYPSGIIEIIHQAEQVKDYVIEVFHNELQTDEVRIHLFVKDGHEKEASRILGHLFQSRLRVMPEIIFATLTQIETLQSSGQGRKLKKFIDNRQHLK